MSRLFCLVLAVPGILMAASGVFAQLPQGAGGLPIGSYITIEGVADHSKFHNFKADTINGVKLKQPLSIEVLTALKPDMRYIFKGYETIRTVGIPEAVYTAQKEIGRPPSPRMGAAFQVQYVFVPLLSVSPRDGTVAPVGAISAPALPPMNSKSQSP